MTNSHRNNNFKKEWVMEGGPTEKQRKKEQRKEEQRKEEQWKEEKRQIKEGKNAEKANNLYGIANYGDNYGQQNDQQYCQANAAGDNYYQEHAANGAVWYNEAAAGHSAPYNYQVSAPVVTDTFIQYGNYANANANVNYQGGSNYYHNRTDENYRTDVATDAMVETINGKHKGKKDAKF